MGLKLCRREESWVIVNQNSGCLDEVLAGDETVDSLLSQGLLCLNGNEAEITDAGREPFGQGDAHFFAQTREWLSELPGY